MDFWLILLIEVRGAMRLIKIDDHTLQVYHHLLQAYEAEFSPITQKEPNTNGLYPLDTCIGGDILGYLVYEGDIPMGACAIKIGQPNEVCEFYVIPTRRNQGIGKRFATLIWAAHPGDWVVKQIAGANKAIAFWRASISQFTKGHYREDVYLDPYWGLVTRQQFLRTQHPDESSKKSS